MTPRHFSYILPIFLLSSASALAHTGSVAGGFVGGLAHPVFGPDHVAAMIAEIGRAHV